VVLVFLIPCCEYSCIYFYVNALFLLYILFLLPLENVIPDKLIRVGEVDERVTVELDYPVVAGNAELRHADICDAVWRALVQVALVESI
jgi:hypothetical protein